MREVLSIMLAVLLVSPGAPAKSPGNGDLKEQVLIIPQGAIVEVLLTGKTKSRGQLGPVSDSGFELQTMKDGKIVTEQIAFGQVKSVKDTGKKSFGHSVSKGFLICRISELMTFGSEKVTQNVRI
jgi:hypothetical protein